MIKITELLPSILAIIVQMVFVYQLNLDRRKVKRLNKIQLKYNSLIYTIMLMLLVIIQYLVVK